VSDTDVSWFVPSQLSESPYSNLHRPLLTAHCPLPPWPVHNNDIPRTRCTALADGAGGGPDGEGGGPAREDVGVALGGRDGGLDVGREGAELVGRPRLRYIKEASEQVCVWAR